MEVIVEQPVEINWTEIGAAPEDKVGAVERRTDKVMRIDAVNLSVGWEDGWGIHPNRLRVYLNEQGAIEEAIIDFSFINPLKRP
jgi:hypothetical protein